MESLFYSDFQAIFWIEKSKHEKSKNEINYEYVQDICSHEGFAGTDDMRIVNINDFSLLILQKPVKFSQTISPICLPMKGELQILETHDNMFLGFGASKVWFVEYAKMMGGKFFRSLLIPVRMFSDTSRLMKAFRTDYFKKKLIQAYIRVFNWIFPGIDICIYNTEFVCKITNKIMDTIVKNINSKIKKIGNKERSSRCRRILGEFLFTFSI